MNKSRPLLEVNGLKKHFPIHGGVLGRVTAKVYAVDGVSFSIDKGEGLGLVGAMVPLFPGEAMSYRDPRLEPVWAAAARTAGRTRP